MPQSRLDLVGIGSMVVDHLHRAPRILGRDEKGLLRQVGDSGPVRDFVGGVVLNHLGWASMLGLRTGIFGKQAEDAVGRFLRAAMTRMEIEHQLVLDGSASSVAEIFVDDAGARTIYMAPGATSETTPEQVREVHADFIRSAARLSTEVSQLPLLATREALRVAGEAQIPTALDLDVPPSDALAGLGDETTLMEVLTAADLLKPSKQAALELIPNSKGDALGLAREVRNRFQNRVVVVTDGEAGCAICADGFEASVPGLRVSAIDGTGAGDAFFGGLLFAMHHGLDWHDAGALANACGAACVEGLGAFPEDPSRLRARVSELYGGAPVALGQTAVDDPRVDPSGTGSLTAALTVLDVAAEEIAALRRRHNGEVFREVADLVERARAAGGRVHVTGIGKPEHVARYAAALLSSTGTPATFLHGTESVHGGAGQIVSGDIVIAVSNSGETTELRETVTSARRRGARIVAVTGGMHSWLAAHADAVLDAAVEREGGPLGLAPRASVAAELLVLAALAALLQERQGFTRADYAERHPAGALGERVQGPPEEPPASSGPRPGRSR
ncbi:MAG: PfkB family carbohydrate kinase [Myxococcota bacterium]